MAIAEKLTFEVDAGELIKAGKELLAIRKSSETTQKSIAGLDDAVKQLSFTLIAHAQALSKVGRETKGAADGADKLSKAQKEAARAAKEKAEAVRVLGLGVVKLESAVNLARMGINAFNKSVSAMSTPVNLAVNFERQFNMIRTLSNDVGEDLKIQLQQLAAQVPQTAADITQAAYQAISSGVKPENTAAFLRSASDLAVAGGGTLTEAVTVLTTALNSYAEKGLTAAEASDILLLTVQKGITTIPELAADLGNISATAATAGITFAELGSAIAGVTKIQGGGTAEAITQINSLIRGLTDPKGEAKLFDTIGFKAGYVTTAVNGLEGQIRLLQEASAASGVELGSLFSRIEANQALLKLVSSGFADMSGAAGKTAEALAKVAGDTQYFIDLFKATSEDMMRQIGEAVLPGFRDAMKEVLDLMNEYGPDVIAAFSEELRNMSKDIKSYLAENGDSLVENIKDIGSNLLKLVAALTKVGLFVANHADAILKFAAGFFVAKKVLAFTSAIEGLVPAIKTLAAAGGIQTALTTALSAVPGPGLAIAAVAIGGFIVNEIATHLRESGEKEFQKALDDAIKSVDVPTLQLGQWDEDLFAAVSEQNLSRIFEERGPEGFEEFVNKQREAFRARMAQLGQVNAKAIEEVVQVERDAFNLLQRGRNTLFTIPREVDTLDKFFQLPIEKQREYNSQLAILLARRNELQQGIKKNENEIEKVRKKGEEGLDETVDKIYDGAAKGSAAMSAREKIKRDKAAERTRKENERAAAEARKDLLALGKKVEDERIAILDEGLAKELLTLRSAHDREREELQSFLAEISRLRKLGFLSEKEAEEAEALIRARGLQRFAEYTKRRKQLIDAAKSEKPGSKDAPSYSEYEAREGFREEMNNARGSTPRRTFFDTPAFTAPPPPDISEMSIEQASKIKNEYIKAMGEAHAAAAALGIEAWDTVGKAAFDVIDKISQAIGSISMAYSEFAAKDAAIAQNRLARREEELDVAQSLEDKAKEAYEDDKKNVALRQAYKAAANERYQAELKVYNAQLKQMEAEKEAAEAQKVFKVIEFGLEATKMTAKAIESYAMAKLLAAMPFGVGAPFVPAAIAAGVGYTIAAGAYGAGAVAAATTPVASPSKPTKPEMPTDDDLFKKDRNKNSRGGRDSDEPGATIIVNFAGQPFTTRTDVEDAIVEGINKAGTRRGARRIDNRRIRRGGR